MEPKRLGVLCCANPRIEIVGEPVLVKGSLLRRLCPGPCYCSTTPRVDSLLPLRHQDGISNCRQARQQEWQPETGAAPGSGLLRRLVESV